jgi:A/G-specific adenine glycosylase
MFASGQSFAAQLLRWYRECRRDLPWRAARGKLPDPYHVLVSETMLQQTQVATVVPYFFRFLKRFPDIKTLARSDEQDVLRLWQGLGYYSRARNLRRAARAIVAEHEGIVPRDLGSLMRLPGIGRYTAGAIASLAYDVRAPILDGNVTRVLCRIDRIESDPRDRDTQQRLWKRALEILPKKNVGDFNSALMELGAMVCTPRTPACLICPVREFCEAHAAGVQETIPPPRKRAQVPLIKRRTWCIRRESDHRWLIEQRPSNGRWAGMWQFVTAPASTRSAPVKIELSKARRLGEITHTLTHRRYHFSVCVTSTSDGAMLPASDRPRVWISLSELSNYPFPRPHLKIAEMLKDYSPVADD